ncbi:MAG: 50S ribosomal protein L24 [Actinomycetota bacterium]|nr:50S ribosomal protein L24 [Euzebyaceae bacterium]MDQ3451155.1 50S ribosomal protein L24 [Actinomycetota bacterium]
MQRVKRNDTVRVISGKDAGKEGRVVNIYPAADRVMVEGINRVTKHQKRQRTRGGGQEGGIVHEEAPIHLSNVMPLCPSCGKPVRVGTKVIDGKRTRYCRKCDSEF